VQTWYAIVRNWSDETGDEDVPWTPFGADGSDGPPMRFVGTAADALRQLEDELGLVARPSIRVERSPRGLLVVRDDDADGGEVDYAEYRLVDTTRRSARKAQIRMRPAGRHRPDQPAVPAPSPPRETPIGAPGRSPAPASSWAAPARFLDEFQEVAGDVAMDFRTTMTDLDAEVGHRVNDFVLELLRLGEDDPGETVRNLMSGMMWMFMVGREHGLRGYPSPVPRGDGESWIPDTVAGIFDDGATGPGGEP
jgi:hypothetical protein